MDFHIHSLLTAVAILSSSQYAAGQLPIGTSTVAGTAEYMGTPVATALSGMPTLAWNCAKMPAICENVHSRNPLTNQGDGFGGLQSGPIELHYDVNPGNERHKQRGQTACPAGWSGRNCLPGVNFVGSNIVCGNGNTLAGECFPGQLWGRASGSRQCTKTPFISFPDSNGGGPTGLIWSCDEWPPKSTVEGGIGANSACAPMRASVIGEALLPPEVYAAENQWYQRSEQDYQADAQNSLRQVVSGQNPAMEGIWAFEFNTFYDDDEGSYATRVTYASGSVTGVISKRGDGSQYVSRLQMANGTIHTIHHRRNQFDARGRLTHWESESTGANGISHYILFARSNITSNSTRSSISFSTSISFTTLTQPASSTSARAPLGTGNAPQLSIAQNSTAPVNVPLDTGRLPGNSVRPPLGTGSAPTQQSNSTGHLSGNPTITPSPNGTVPLGTGTFTTIAGPTNGSGPVIPLDPSDATGATLAATTTITPTSISTTLVPATVAVNTTITTTGADGSPTVVPELVGCDACAAAAIIIFGLPPGVPPAVYDIPGVGLIPIGPDGTPLDAMAAAAATDTTSAADPSETDGDPDACDLVVFGLGGDGEMEDDSYTPTTSAAPPPPPPPSTEAPPPPDETPQPQICAASRPEIDCTKDSDCSCPVIPDCNLIASCEQESAAGFRCWCTIAQ